MTEKHPIFFNEATHTYWDSDGTFTSMTTLIGKFYPKFDAMKMALNCERAGTNPNSPSYEKYKGKTAKMIMQEWDNNTKKALTTGTSKHAFLERCIKVATKYSGYSGERLFTIEDIDGSQGNLDAEDFSNMISNRYPEVSKFIKQLHDEGYKFFSEICTFDLRLRISGLIDLMAVKDNKEFRIIDWKTNRDDISYSSGYMEKLADGTRTGKFIETDETMLEPLTDLSNSVGTKYNLQVSGYAHLVEKFGYQNLRTENVIYQIREVDGVEKTNQIILKDFDEPVSRMFGHWAEINRLW